MTTIRTERDFSDFKMNLRNKIMGLVEDEYQKLRYPIGFDVDGSEIVQRLYLAFPLDTKQFEADMRDLISDAFWQVALDYAREENVAVS
jgi:hypothetical protein